MRLPCQNKLGNKSNKLLGKRSGNKRIYGSHNYNRHTKKNPEAVQHLRINNWSKATLITFDYEKYPPSPCGIE
jgi:hypothetical protein